MRLIDADAVYKILESCEIRKATIGNPLTDWEYGYTCGIERAESEIECAPTADAEPVIRCKDCKYFELDHFDMVDFPTETGNAVSVPIITAHEICSKWSDGCKTSANGYCFMAERKEECSL